MKRLVWLLVLVTCLISVIILTNLYFISSTEEQKGLLMFSSKHSVQHTHKDVHNERDVDVQAYVQDKELLELEKRIQYILDQYKDGNHPNFGAGVDSLDAINLKLKMSNLFQEKEREREKAAHKSKFKFRFNFGNSHSAHSSKQKRFKYKEKKASTSVAGVLNAHIWEGWCGPRVEDLKRDKHFPLYPSFKTNVSLFFAQWNEAGYGERIFGYIHPPETGKFIFAGK